MKKQYTLTEICESLDTHKTKIRRAISELGIEAINEHDRKHANSPKIYNEKAKEAIIKELKNEQELNKSETRAEQELNSETQKEMIELLKEQLNLANITKQELNKSETRAEQELNKGETRAEQELNSETQKEMIELLKEQLKSSDRDKQELVRALQEAQQLVNQQQRLSLQANQKIETLELELRETFEDDKKTYKPVKENKRKWYNIFKRN